MLFVAERLFDESKAELMMVTLKSTQKLVSFLFESVYIYKYIYTNSLKKNLL